MASYFGGATLGAATRTNSSFTVPASAPTGAISIIFFDYEGSTPPVPPAGYRRLQNVDNSGQINDFWGWWKRLGASEGGTTHTVTHGSTWTNGALLVVQNVHATAVPRIGAPNQGVGTLATALSVKPIGNDAYIMFGIVTFGDMGLVAPPAGTAPTFTERYDSTNNVYVADGTLATAAATGNLAAGSTFGGGSQAWISFMILVEDVNATVAAPQRFYLPASGTAPASPTISADWSHSSGTRRPMSATKGSTTIADTLYAPDAGDHLVQDESMFVQFVSSETFAAQTILAGQVVIQARMLEATALNNLFLAWKLMACAADDSAVLATLIPYRQSGIIEVGTALTNRGDDAVAAETVLSESFRLVLEVGMAGTPSAGAGTNGHNGSISFGESSASDMAEDEASTTANNPWIEIALALTAAGGAVQVTVTGAQPAASGTIGSRQLLKNSIAGAQPAASATLKIKQPETVAGAQLAPSGSLNVKQPETLAGSQPSATGAVTAKQARTVSGAQPAPSGAIAAKQLLKLTVSGAQPAATGAISAKQTLKQTVAGVQPSASSTLTSKQYRTLAGAQPAASGAVSAVTGPIEVTVAGAQAAPTGSIAARALLFPIVQVADTKNGTVTVDSTSWTLTYPTNIVEGDLLVLAMSWDGGGGITAQHGFTNVEHAEWGTNSCDIFLMYAAGTETGTMAWTMPLQQGAWRIFRVSGVYAGATLGGANSDVHSVVEATGNSANPNPPSTNPANWDVEDTLWFVVMSADNAPTMSAFPSGYTDNAAEDNTGTGAAGSALYTSWRTNAVVSDDPAAGTISASNDWIAYTLAIRPASGQPTIAGVQPAATGAIAAKQTLKRTLAGTQPAATGAVAQKYRIAITAVQPSATGAVSTRQLLKVTLAGSQPPAAGAISAKQLLKLTVAGSQPAATGAVTQKYRITLSAAQPSATGALAARQSLKRALAGIQPSAAGTINAKQYRTISGAQPAASGTVTARSVVAVNVDGDQPAATGTVTARQTLRATLAGSQPSATGALNVKQPETLTGAQAAPAGALTARQVLHATMAGVQPAASGAVSAQTIGPGEATVSGAQPAATGVLAIKYRITLAAAQPSASGQVNSKQKRTVAGAQPAASATVSARSVVAITISGAQPAPSATIARRLLLVRTITGAQPAASGALSVRLVLRHISLTGVQPSATATVTAKQALKLTVAGVQPYPTGVLAPRQLLHVPIAGIQPAATGAIRTPQLFFATVSGTQPAPTGLLTADIGFTPYFVTVNLTARYNQRAVLVGQRSGGIELTATRAGVEV